MTKLTSLFVISFFWGLTTFAQATKVDSSSMITLRIDPESARGATVSQLFDEVEFIPLETTKESLFGGISQLSVTKNYFVLFDYDTKAVLIFDKSGKFHAKINADLMKSDDDPKETTTFYGFRMVRVDNEDQILTFTKKYGFYFNLSGKLIQKKLLKELTIEQVNTFGDQTRAVKQNALTVKGNDSSYHEIALLKDKIEIAKYFPFSIRRFKNDQYIGNPKIYAYNEPNEFLYHRYYDFNIYKITPEKLSLAYRIILPVSNSLPKDFLTNDAYRNKQIEYFQKNDNVFYGLSDTYKIDDLLFFKLASLGGDRNRKSGMIYNLSSGELLSIKDIEPDVLSSFLPITDAGAFFDYNNRGINAFGDQSFYTSYSSLAMFTFKEQSVGKNPQYNAVLADYFKTQNKKSNPVLIRLKPKKHIN
ncbi:MAG: 6-bladed beta-propeller [Chitinophagaceae bacterium]|nr:MAG: 6-bladed beta-propeller [Chitinophagaceae bacterium]